MASVNSIPAPAKFLAAGTLNGQIFNAHQWRQPTLFGSGQVSGGLNTVNGQIPALTNWRQPTLLGSSQVSGGANQLETVKSRRSQTGVSQLYSGSSQVSGGFGTLNGQVPTPHERSQPAGQWCRSGCQWRWSIECQCSNVRIRCQPTRGWHFSQITAQSGTLKSGSLSLKWR